MKTLFLPHNFRHDYFHGFIRHSVAQRDWRVGVICLEEQRRAFADAIGETGEYFFHPDFGVAQAWENDVVECRRIEALVEAAERASGISFNRVLLAGERDIGRPFSAEFFYWPENAIAKAARRDPATGVAAVLRMFKFMDEVFEKFEPECVVSGATSSPIHFVASLVAELRNVPFLINRRSKIHAKRCFWTFDRTMLNREATALYAEKRAANAPISEMSVEYAGRFQSKPETIHYIKEFWDYAASARQWWNWHKHCAQLVLAHAAHVVKRRSGQPPKPVWGTLSEYYRMRFVNWRQKRLLHRFDEVHLKEVRYIYFPFHKEPEMAINVQAYPWHSQIHTVQFLSALLPLGYRLLVREHRGTRGRRPTRFLKSMASLPGVDVIDPLDSQFKYIQNADLIITDNGSTGWEGVMFEKPVITLHENFYDTPALTTHVTDLTALNGEIIRLLHQDESVDKDDYYRRMGWFLDAEWETSFPEDEDHHHEGLAQAEALLAR